MQMIACVILNMKDRRAFIAPDGLRLCKYDLIYRENLRAQQFRFEAGGLFHPARHRRMRPP